MSRGSQLGLGGLVAALSLAFAPAAGAATINVTTTVDEFGTGAACSVREAVQTANQNSDFGGCTREGGGSADAVGLSGGETYALSLPGTEDVNAGGDLDVIGDLTIAVGGTGRATLDGGDIDRVIEVRPGAVLNASRLIVTNGETDTTQSGGGIYSAGRLVLKKSIVRENHIPGTNGSGSGGGIAAFDGTTILKDTILKNNLIESLGSGGGVLQSRGTLRLKNTTVDGNTAYGGGGIVTFDDTKMIVKASTISRNVDVSEQYGGGGVFAYDGNAGTTKPIRFTNVTISSNRSNTRGGGIYAALSAGGTVDLNAVTVTLNIADANANGAGTIGGAGGGVHGNVAFKNSIVADNTATTVNADDCYQTSNLGHNVVGRTEGCANTGVGTLDPRLGPLADNGGLTKTHALKKGSPAIGRAGSSAPSHDQRGRKRDSNPDAGSFERGA